MLETILDTKAKMRIAALFSRKKGSLQVSDVARALNMSKSRASECLRELEKSGVLVSRPVGRSVMYGLAPTKLAKYVTNTLNQDEKLIRSIEIDLKKELMALRPVSVARFGSSLAGLKAGSDVDFIALFEGKTREEKIYEICAKLSGIYGIRISVMHMGVKEFREKAKRGEEFVLKLAATHKLVYGKDPEGLIWPEK